MIGGAYEVKDARAGMVDSPDLQHFLGGLVGLDGPIRDIGEGYGIFLTGILVIVGWWVSARQDTNKFRKERSHQYIIGSREKLQEQLAVIADNLRLRSPIDRVELLEADDALDGGDCGRAIKALLTQLEIIAVDLRLGYASERYIQLTQKSLIRNLYYCSRLYIVSVREARNQRTAFSNFEILAQRIVFGRQGPFLRFLELLINRPLFSFFDFSFRLKYSVLRGLGLVDALECEDFDHIKQLLTGLDLIALFLLSASLSFLV